MMISELCTSAYVGLMLEISVLKPARRRRRRRRPHKEEEEEKG